MHSLLRVCREVLEDPSSTIAMRKVAGTAVTTALNEAIGMPIEYVRAAWRWLRTSDSYYGMFDGIAEVPDEVVRAEALGLLKDPNTGRDERRLASWVLGGRGHAGYLDDHAVLDLVERTKTGEHADDLGGLLAKVNTARGIPHEVLSIIRNRWTSSTSAGVREAGVKVGTELMAPDLAWVGRVLDDPDADVRVSLANAFTEPVEGLLDLLQQRLEVETAPDVRAALCRGIADQEQVESDRARRKRRRREAAEEASQHGADGSDPT